jgi:peptidyl-tRNA hydrolase, PTH1 family
VLGRSTPADLLVIGLGNPGADYEFTRHNVGADCIALLAHRSGARLKAGRERALVAELTLAGKRIVVAFPQTFMNLSGESVKPLTKKYGITDLGQLIVVHDELDLPSARLKVKVGGGAGGHNGLKSISALCGGQDYVRVRIGIGRPPGRQDPADYVLRRPAKAERELLDVCIAEAADAVEALVTEPVANVMTRINAAPTP